MNTSEMCILLEDHLPFNVKEQNKAWIKARICKIYRNNHFKHITNFLIMKSVEITLFYHSKLLYKELISRLSE